MSAASTASMLTVTRFRPASLSGWASDSSRWPLVVSARSSGSPSRVRRRDSSCTRSTSPRRNSGSPPVSRTLVMPRLTKIPISRRYSSMASSGYCGAHLAGAAVDAFVVAAVGDGDAQVVNHAAMAIRERRMRRRRGKCGEGRGSHRQLSSLYPFCSCHEELRCASAARAPA